MVKTVRKTLRDNAFMIGIIIFILNTLFMHFTGSKDSLFIVEEGIRTDVWYCTIYLSFIFIFLSKIEIKFIKLAFLIALARGVYNFLILLKVIEYGKGWSDFLTLAIVLIFAFSEGVKIIWRKY